MALSAREVAFVLFVLAFIAYIGAILLKPNRPPAGGSFHRRRVFLDIGDHTSGYAMIRAIAA